MISKANCRSIARQVHIHPSLRNEDVGLLFEAMRKLLAERSYKRRDLIWYSHTPDLIRVLSFAPGLTRIRAHFAVGIALHVLDGVDDPTTWDSVRPLRCRATHPQIEDCAISASLRHLVSDRPRYDELTDFTDRSRSHSESIPHILEVLTTCALPFLEAFSTLEDVRRFAQSERVSAFAIREAAKTILFPEYSQVRTISGPPNTP